MASVEFYYEGRNITVQCNKNDTMEKIFQQFIAKTGVNPNSIVFLYNGSSLTNKYLTFSQLSNKEDKIRNKMNILVSNSLSQSPSQFIFLDSMGADESMKDYAKMAILLAIQEYPNDYKRKAKLIFDKFKEKYSGDWVCSFMKFNEGSTAFGCEDIYMGIKYGDYKIIIIKTNY